MMITSASGSSLYTHSAPWLLPTMPISDLIKALSRSFMPEQAMEYLDIATSIASLCACMPSGTSLMKRHRGKESATSLRGKQIARRIGKPEIGGLRLLTTIPPKSDQDVGENPATSLLCPAPAQDQRY